MTTEKFEHFLALMEENWPQAYENMLHSLPCIDKIQSINEATRVKVMAEYGLQSSDFGLLTALRRSPPPYLLTPTQLMNHMLISSGGLTKALYRLEAKGMISRKDSMDDGRVKLVQLNDEGKEVIEGAMTKIRLTYKVLNEVFSDQEKKQLDSLLIRLLGEMEKISQRQ